MSIYIYPAILTYADDCYYVKFPDIDNCFTDGNTRLEALEMANDVLPLMLCDYEDRNLDIPKPSESKNIKLSSNEEIIFVKANTTLYRKKYLKSTGTETAAAKKEAATKRVARPQKQILRKAAEAKAVKRPAHRKAHVNQRGETDKQVFSKRT